MAKMSDGGGAAGSDGAGTSVTVKRTGRTPSARKRSSKRK